MLEALLNTFDQLERYVCHNYSFMCFSTEGNFQ